MWTGTTRPGNLVDSVVNLNQAAGGASRPAPVFHDGDLWVQGLALGMEVSY